MGATGEVDCTTITLKLLVVGEMGTGKTSIVRQYVLGCFTEFYKGTMGADFAQKEIDIDASTRVRLHLWDIGGQERLFGAGLTHIFCRLAVGALVVFDVAKPETLDIADVWKAEVCAKALTSTGAAVPCLLIGNKIDLFDNRWARSAEVADWAREHGFIGYMETSARKNTNLSEAIELLVRHVLTNQIEPYEDRDAGVDLQPTEEAPRKCC